MTTTNPNPLIDQDPSNTLDRASAALDLLGWLLGDVRYDDELQLTSRQAFGLHNLLATVQAAVDDATERLDRRTVATDEPSPQPGASEVSA